MLDPVRCLYFPGLAWAGVPKKTFVLVPGAWLGAWAWRRVVPLLERDGGVVYPVTLTGMGDRVHLASPQIGLETAIEDVVNTIVYEGLEDVVLAGHSFAGKVIAAVADRMPVRVRDPSLRRRVQTGERSDPSRGLQRRGLAFARRRMEDSSHRGDTRQALGRTSGELTKSGWSPRPPPGS